MEKIISMKSTTDKNNMSCFSKNIENEPILYIRHGKTTYNKDADFLDDVENALTAHKIRWDEKYLDDRLNEEGIQQAKDLAKQLKSIKVYKVFCSPLRRCIETCLNALSSHPQKKSIEIVIHPLLTEITHTIHDGSSSIPEKIAFYSKNSDLKIDWSNMKNLDHTYNYRYLNNMPQMNSNDNGFCDNSNVKFADIIKECFTKTKKRPESIDSAFLRANEFKDFLCKNVLDDVNGTKEIDGKVLVFSHSGFIRVSTLSRYFKFNDDDGYYEDSKYEDKYPEIVYYPKNGEIIGINVRE